MTKTLIALLVAVSAAFSAAVSPVGPVGDKEGSPCIVVPCPPPKP